MYKANADSLKTLGVNIRPTNILRKRRNKQTVIMKMVAETSTNAEHNNGGESRPCSSFIIQEFICKERKEYMFMIHPTYNIPGLR